MRMRRKKNGEARLAACAHLCAERPEAPATHTGEWFGREAPLYLEVGCGKGAFACGMAAKHPEVCFLAMERVTDVAIAALEKAEERREERREDNLRFAVANAEVLEEFLAPDTVDKLFLNFSDPWPKKGYAKRRLTHRRFLDVYFRLLKTGGEFRLKTDNRGLFEFTLEELDALGLQTDFVTTDLHRSPYAEGNVMTEYETNFSAQGMPIYSLAVTKTFTGNIPQKSEE